MRELIFHKRFKRDYEREKKSGYYKPVIDNLLSELLKMLVSDISLPIKYHDHALINNWHDCRDCHIKPDLILIYRKPDTKTLELIRLGSHSQLGL